MSRNNVSTEPSTTEPGDPENGNHEARRQIRLTDVQIQKLPKFFVECGCGECPDAVDPLYDSEVECRSDFWASEICPSPRAVSVERAREIYIRYERSLQQREDRTGAHERQRCEQYPRILSADRHFRAKYGGLTTVMFTRRLSPTDDAGDWFSPLQLDLMLHNSAVMKRVRKALRYYLGSFEFEYLRVTAPTTSAATPHEHRYLWIDDPNNKITVEHIEPALQGHLSYCVNATGDHHEYDPAGENGAITIRHAPPLVDQEPEKVAAVQRGSKALEGVDARLKNTRGAQYLASQLAHMPLWNEFDSNESDPERTLLEGGAIAKATPSKWFGTSNGVPKLSS